MKKYFKITNKWEIHDNIIYHDGLNNIDNTSSDSTNSAFYFTTIDYIPKYYYIGINLREIFLPNDPDFKIVKMLDDGKYRANKVIFGKKYSLYDPLTYKKFGLNMEYNIHLVNHASEHGDIDFLDTWKKNAWNLKYSTDAIDLASQNGHVFILDWWKNSGFKLKYTQYAIDWACEMGHEAVLCWWAASGFEMKYTYKSILLAIKNGHKCIIEWWKNNMVVDNKNIIIPHILNNRHYSSIMPSWTNGCWLEDKYQYPILTKKDMANSFQNITGWFVSNGVIIILNLLFVMMILFLYIT